MRATFSFAMAPLAVNVFGAVMLMILQPFLKLLLENAAEQKFDMGPVITIAIVVTVFVMVMIFGLGAVAAIGRGFGFNRGRSEERSVQRLPAPDRGPRGHDRQGAGRDNRGRLFEPRSLLAQDG